MSLKKEEVAKLSLGGTEAPPLGFPVVQLVKNRLQWGSPWFYT